MKIIPNEARLELYGLQVICAAMPELDYVDHIWTQRYGDVPKPKGAWPYRPAADGALPSNVTPIKSKKPGRG